MQRGQSLIKRRMVGSEPIPGGQAKEVGFAAGLAVTDTGYVALPISHTCGVGAPAPL